MLWKLLIAVANFFAGIFHVYSPEFAVFHASPTGPQSNLEAHIAYHSLYGGHEEMIKNPSGAGIRDNRTRWTGFPGKGEIPYVIEEPLATKIPTPYRVQKNLLNFHSPKLTESIEHLIKEAIEQYHTNTCIRFVKRTHQRDYIRLIKDKGCYSFVGRVGGSQPVSIGRGCEYVGTIVHELGHAVGLYHEHQRSDRDKYLTIHEDNVIQGQLHNFRKTPTSDEMILNLYDYMSIMHYGNFAFSKRPLEVRTMEAKDGTALLDPYDRPGLNDLDIAKVKKLYHC